MISREEIKDGNFDCFNVSNLQFSLDKFDELLNKKTKVWAGGWRRPRWKSHPNGDFKYKKIYLTDKADDE